MQGDCLPAVKRRIKMLYRKSVDSLGTLPLETPQDSLVPHSPNLAPTYVYEFDALSRDN